MKSEVLDDVQHRDTGASDVVPVDERKGRELKEPSEGRSLRKEHDDLTGRAYAYFHKLQELPR